MTKEQYLKKIKTIGSFRYTSELLTDKHFIN